MAAPLADIFDSLRQELGALHVEASALQAALPTPADAPGRAALQRLDALTQALDALAGYAGGLEGAARAGAPLDPAAAAAAVPLHDMAARLARRPASRPSACAALGDVELF